LNTLALIPLLTSFFYLVLLALALQRAGNRTGKLFAYYLSVAATWSFTSFMVHLNAPESQTLFWNKILVVALIWTLVAYYHFALGYTERRPGVLLLLAYLALIGLAIASFTGHVVEYSRVVNGITDYQLYVPAAIYMAITGFAFSILVLSLLIVKYRHSSDPRERNRTMYLFAAWVLLVLLTYTNYIPGLQKLPLDHIGNFINALIISYAISQYRLLDIKLVARTALAYAISIALVLGGCIGTILLVLRVFPNENTTSIILFVTIIFILLIAIFRPLHKLIQRVVDKLFYPQTYEYRNTLMSFSSKMSFILDLNELALEMLPTLCKAIDINWAGMLLQSNDSGDFSLRYVQPEPVIKQEFNLSADSLVVSWLDRNDQALDPKQIDNIPEFKGLWQAEKEQLTNSDLGMLYPLKSRDHMVCILALGQKRVSRIFTHEDLELVRAMASQAGIIIENAQLFTQANTRATTDELTGLYNHRHFHERLEQEIARGSRFGNTFSLIMIDIDLFKSYNDIYGHLAGDQVLRRVGHYLASSIRSIDMAFRYGGEEFAIILPEARLDDAFKVAERIRKTIESKSSSRSMPITVSLGLANWPNDGVMKEEIIGRADAALYRAKELGRNRTCLSSEVVKMGTELIENELEAQPKALSIIYALAATVDAKDSYTYGHSRKVSEYAVLMGEAMKMPPDKISILRAAGLLHDIGKVGVPDSILTKKSALTSEEWNPIRTHPALGVEILKHVIDLVNCLPAIQHHHEHYDGSGYPDGLKTASIPLEARILAIADAYDAMTSPRPYRSQLPLEDALLELHRCAGTQFDPDLVEIFCSMMHPHLLNDKKQS
jgi:diguanylate cyclase (GGDEF)-like protein